MAGSSFGTCPVLELQVSDYGVRKARFSSASPGSGLSCFDFRIHRIPHNIPRLLPIARLFCHLPHFPRPQHIPRPSRHWHLLFIGQKHHLPVSKIPGHRRKRRRISRIIEIKLVPFLVPHIEIVETRPGLPSARSRPVFHQQASVLLQRHHVVPH